MIEKTIYDYLNSNLPEGVQAFLEKPATAPEHYVLIEKTGSSVTDHIVNASIALQSYAGSLYEAAELNDAVKAVMDDLITLDGIYRSHCDSDYNFTDTATKKYRYQAVYEVYYQEG